MTNFEDHMVERKTVADMNDALKTVVAFANSAPIGYPCVLYIGVRDDGSFETKFQDFDKLQKQLEEQPKKTDQEMKQLQQKWQTFTITPLPDEME